MNIVYCFIGPLPSYSVDTIHQLRLFYNGPVYFILSDLSSEYVPILKTKYNVNIISYTDVIDYAFCDTMTFTNHKFCYVSKLVGRENLFRFAFERFFVLKNLMNMFALQNVLFLELDNLVYDNPLHWKDGLCKKDMAFMFDNFERCASGVSFFKHASSLTILTNFFMEFIKHSTKFMSEMDALWDFWQINKDNVQILPTHWGDSTLPIAVYENYKNYNNAIFDSAAIGIYLGGLDPIHSDGILKKGQKWWGSLIDYTQYVFEWRIDEEGRNIPFIQTKEGQWLKLNNLHIHSKQLKGCLSKEILA